MARMECVEQSRSVSPIGALAQLGERLICIQEVNGSIPLGSTKTFTRSSRPSAGGFDRPVRDELLLPYGVSHCEIDIV